MNLARGQITAINHRPAHFDINRHFINRDQNIVRSSELILGPNINQVGTQHWHIYLDVLFVVECDALIAQNIQTTTENTRFLKTHLGHCCYLHHENQYVVRFSAVVHIKTLY